MTTDVSCLRDKDAEAILKLQAGFRPDYAPEIEHISILEYLLETTDTFVSSICVELGVNYVDLAVWTNALYNEIKRCLESVEEKKGQARPTTGNIDFCAAKKAFKKAKNEMVITKVDKAANCVCIMCKACYKRVVMQKLDSPAYKRVERDTLETVMDNIIERQQEVW